MIVFSMQMEEKKGSNGGRMVGSKVSQIANIFQAMTPVKGEGEVSPVEAPKSAETNVTVVRTESHVARFNNARALFEKLGESWYSAVDEHYLSKRARASQRCASKMRRQSHDFCCQLANS